MIYMISFMIILTQIFQICHILIKKIIKLMDNIKKNDLPTSIGDIFQILTFVIFYKKFFQLKINMRKKKEYFNNRVAGFIGFHLASKLIKLQF